MLESGPSGSVRGVPSNGHPYRDPGSFATKLDRSRHVRFTPDSDQIADNTGGPLRAKCGWTSVMSITAGHHHVELLVGGGGK